MVSVRNSTVQPGRQGAAFHTVSTSCPGAARAPRPGGLNMAQGAGASADTPSLSAGRAEQPHPQHHRGLVQPKHKEIRPWSRTRELRQHRRAPGPRSHPGQGASAAGETCPARRVLNRGCRSVPGHQGRTSSPSCSPGPPQRLRLLGAQAGAETWSCLRRRHCCALPCVRQRPGSPARWGRDGRRAGDP